VVANLHHGERQRLPLAKLINLVANEIILANQLAANREQPIMTFEESEVELAFEVEVNAEGGVELFGVTLGANAAQTTTHKIKVKYLAAADVVMQGTAQVGLKGGVN